MDDGDKYKYLFLTVSTANTRTSLHFTPTLIIKRFVQVLGLHTPTLHTILYFNDSGTHLDTSPPQNPQFQSFPTKSPKKNPLISSLESLETKKKGGKTNKTSLPQTPQKNNAQLQTTHHNTLPPRSTPPHPPPTPIHTRKNNTTNTNKRPIL
ncbi:unnamed protein product [Periconia digitata]|uniref:Uncharacterized protein n=1 Tax=Periconia digitata TaxID=1303443 RepID=A0A9W4U235_9PLEO|nr:unnamed protein product [Periconia digitata]